MKRGTRGCKPSFKRSSAQASLLYPYSNAPTRIWAHCNLFHAWKKSGRDGAKPRVYGGVGGRCFELKLRAMMSVGYNDEKGGIMTVREESCWYCF